MKATDQNIADEINAYVQQFWVNKRRPEYTCPNCRAPIQHKPLPEHRLKGLAAIVGKALGEIENNTDDMGTGDLQEFFPTWGHYLVA